MVENTTGAPMNRLVCPMCGASVPDGFTICRAVFEALCARDYSEPAFGAVHLISVDAYALQHSEEHGPRSNAFHLLRLCSLVERGGDPALGRRPSRQAGKEFEARYRDLPSLEPPRERGRITVADVWGATEPAAHAERVRAWGRSVFEAYGRHHDWARNAQAELPAIVART